MVDDDAGGAGTDPTAPDGVPAWAPPSSVPPPPPPFVGSAPMPPFSPPPTPRPTTPPVPLVATEPATATTAAPTWPSGPTLTAERPGAESTLPASPPLEPPVIGGAPLHPFAGAGTLPPGPPGPADAVRLTSAPLPTLPTRPPAEPGTATTSRRTFALAVLATAIVVSLLTAGLVLLVDRGRSSAPAASAPGNSQLANRSGLDIQALLQKAQPSVVSIQTGQKSTTGVFGAAGSGVIISDDGLVLTNAHVIEGATTMQVTLSDGRSVAADLVGSLPGDDVALISLRDPGTVTPAELGESASVQVGDDVVAIGNALNLGGPPSVTEGIISAKDRTIEAGNETLKNLIQTDAAINPGNSGGPLLNAQGQVVGINTAIISDAQNIGFAIAIDSIKPLIQQIKDGRGAVTKDTAFLGVSTQAVGEISPDVLATYGVRTTDGAFITDLSAGAAAAGAGLQLGDVITAIDGQPMSTSQDVVDVVQSHQPGDKIVVTYERGGQTASVTVTLGSHG